MLRYEPTKPGDRFGMLVVREARPRKVGRHNQWLCECDCGNKVEVQQSKLRSGGQISCGCSKFKH